LFQIAADTKVAAWAENPSQESAQTAFIKVKFYDTDAGEGLSNETAPPPGLRLHLRRPSLNKYTWTPWLGFFHSESAVIAAKSR
jgi:hypothetical protein